MKIAVDKFRSPVPVQAMNLLSSLETKSLSATSWQYLVVGRGPPVRVEEAKTKPSQPTPAGTQKSQFRPFIVAQDQQFSTSTDARLGATRGPQVRGSCRGRAAAHTRLS